MPEKLDVQIDENNLTSEELGKAKSLLNKWSDIFSTGPTDLGRTDLVQLLLTSGSIFLRPGTQNPASPRSLKEPYRKKTSKYV